MLWRYLVIIKYGHLSFGLTLLHYISQWKWEPITRTFILFFFFYVILQNFPLFTMRTNVHYVTNDLHRLFQDICSLAGSYAQLKKKKQKTKKGFPTFLYWRKKITKFKNRWKGYKTYVLYRHALLSLYTLWFMINRAMPFRKIIWYHLIILWIF